MGLDSQQNGTAIQRNRHTEFKRTSAMSRGILKRKKGKETIYFNGDSTDTELVFQTIHCVNQLSI